VIADSASEELDGWSIICGMVLKKLVGFLSASPYQIVIAEPRDTITTCRHRVARGARCMRGGHR
jgi:hypothetical protein